MKRSYRQFCALARALDVVGERWTLLIARELLLGPRRYSDLLGGLPGIGTNLLAERLRHLEEAGVVERTVLPAPASHAYRLTERGRELEPTLVALAHWGMSPMAPPRREERRRPGWYALALRSAFRPEAATGLREDYEFRIEGETFHLCVRDGEAELCGGEAPEPAFTLEARIDDFLAIATGRRAPEWPARLVGDRAAFRRWLEAFHLPGPRSPDPIRACSVRTMSVQSATSR